jgi:hypothetical protein
MLWPLESNAEGRRLNLEPRAFNLQPQLAAASSNDGVTTLSMMPYRIASSADM